MANILIDGRQKFTMSNILEIYQNKKLFLKNRVIYKKIKLLSAAKKIFKWKEISKKEAKYSKSNVLAKTVIISSS